VVFLLFGPLFIHVPNRLVSRVADPHSAIFKIQIRILFLSKVLHICDPRPKDPARSHFETLQSTAPEFYFDGDLDSDSALHCNADLDPAFQKNAYPDLHRFLQCRCG
jgi:hypothetical protein